MKEMHNSINQTQGKMNLPFAGVKVRVSVIPVEVIQSVVSNMREERQKREGSKPNGECVVDKNDLDDHAAQTRILTLMKETNEYSRE